MTTENYEFKVDDVIVGDTGIGTNMGYYIETKTDKNNSWIYYGTNKNKSRGIHVLPIDKVRPAKPDEIYRFEN